MSAFIRSFIYHLCLSLNWIEKKGGEKIPHNKNEVVILKEKTPQGGTALATLAPAIAVSVVTTHGTGLLNAFLMKKARGTLWIDDMDASDMLIVGMARGDATITEIKAALENADVARDRTGQASIRQVVNETLTLIWRDAAAGDVRQSMEIEVSLGGGKGIPFGEGQGWQWFVYNAGANAQVAGALFNMEMTYYGAWLGS